MSFDQIGDIIVLDDKGTKKQAQTLLKKVKTAKVVLKRSDIHKGRYRTQKLSWLAGEKRKETIHKESGCLLKLDVEKCYFSPRSSNERLRILKQIKKTESILVMFSGIAPFPCIIAKNKPVKEIYAIEMNPTAHKYAIKNIKLNKLTNVKLFKGDVRKVLEKTRKKFDRIIMPLPKTAESFLDVAKNKLKRGGIIHLYTFLEETEIKKVPNQIVSKYFKKFKILRTVKCGHYSPYVYRVCIDIKL